MRASKGQQGNEAAFSHTYFFNSMLFGTETRKGRQIHTDGHNTFHQLSVQVKINRIHILELTSIITAKKSSFLPLNYKGFLETMLYRTGKCIGSKVTKKIFGRKK